MIKGDSATAPTKTLRVLVIEDDPLDVDLVVSSLEKEGYAITYDVVDEPRMFREKCLSHSYDVVLADIESSVERAADRLRRALDAGPAERLEDEASAARKIFQTGYYQTLRLRPSSGPDRSADARAALGRACEAYDWASRMLGSESVRNPLVLDAARRLMDAGDASLTQVARELPPVPDAPHENTAP